MLLLDVRGRSDWAVAASPKEHMWTQSTGLYVGGDQKAFTDVYSGPVIPVVSQRFPPLEAFV